jgi:hypothetical protein
MGMNQQPGMYMPPGARSRPHQGRMITCLVLGSLLLLAGILASIVPLDHGTVSQWNGLCSSDLGQLGQLLSGQARSDCGSIGVADHAIGWLLGGGVVAMLAGIGLAIAGRRPTIGGMPGRPVRKGWTTGRITAAAAAAAVLAAGLTWGAVASASPGAQLQSYLCWSGPGDSGATLLQWPGGVTVDGTYRQATVSGTAPDQQVTTSSGALTGTIAGASASLDLDGTSQIYGKLGTDLVLNVPQQDGTLQPVTCKPGSSAGWNQALADLNSQTNGANTQAAAAQQAQQLQQQVSQAQSSLASDAVTLSQDATSLDTDKTLAGDIQQMRNDLATEQAAYGVVQGDSCSSDYGATIETDADTVDSDADTVDSDLDTLQGDIQSLQGNSVQDDLSAVESDVSALQNLGATPSPNPAAAIKAGKTALQDFSKAVQWANANGNQIDSEAHQIDNEADNLANC